LARETRQDERFLFDRKDLRNLRLFARVTLRSENRLFKQDAVGCFELPVCISTGIDTMVAALPHCTSSGEDLLVNFPLFDFVTIALVMMGSCNCCVVFYYDGAMFYDEVAFLSHFLSKTDPNFIGTKGATSRLHDIKGHYVTKS
jgi:hypothetical protein